MNETSAARYRLIRQIGAGGMAQVVEAVATGAAGFERRVAIKWVLPENSEDDAMRRMFLDEARIASHLHHANIVQVLDYGLMDGTEFIVCEFVDGLDMDRARRRAGGTVPQTVALHVVSEMGHALDHAHNRTDAAGRALGIVHRDVSPANILVSWDGDVKLSDFGIAYALTREEKTQTGYVKGKAKYMAPEQALGSDITGAADVFALGVVLQMLTTGRSPRMYGHVVEDEPEVDLDEDLAELLSQCLAEDPRERPSARAVAEVAERLRSRRTEDTGRRELREWLRPLSTGAAPRRIDQFAGQVVVEQGSNSRVYTLSRPEEDTIASADPPRSPDTVTVSLPVRRLGVAWLGVVAAVVVVTASAAWLWSGSESAERRTPPADTPEPAGPLLDAHAESQTDQAAFEDPGPTQPSPMVAAGAEPEPRVTLRPARMAVARPEMRPRDAPPARGMDEANPEGSATDETAAAVWFKVVGHLGQRVYLDRRPVGWAPGDFQTTTGPHRVEIRGPADEVLGGQRIELGAQHASKQRALVVRISAAE